jgi:hypothetical protein
VVAAPQTEEKEMEKEKERVQKGGVRRMISEASEKASSFRFSNLRPQGEGHPALRVW